jgi:hypothetical protein
LLGLPEVVECLTIEFPVRQKLASDMVVRLADGRILHVELQSKNDPRMLFRCLEYWQVWPRVDIVQVVIFVGDGPMRMESEIARGRLSFGFDILNMQAVEATSFLQSESDSERIAAALCRSDDPGLRSRRFWRHGSTCQGKS